MEMTNQKKYSILIIDDEKSNITVLTDILHDEYKILVVKDSREAVETAENQMPDIILLDIIMPYLDGYEVLAGLKASELTKDIPVIFTTGLDCEKEKAKGMAHGIADYIAKPFHASMVKLRVARQLEKLE
ncbi:MAG: response regulator [Oscillospiraceae bacterium]|nr:response regulator [Oscillospiraceae bacterium]